MLKGIEPAGYRKIICGNTLFIKHLHLGAEDWEPVFTADQLREAVLREREECASLLEQKFTPLELNVQEHSEWNYQYGFPECAAAIRARG